MGFFDSGNDVEMGTYLGYYKIGTVR
jgi:hydroxymethylpyrimidine pyrophosphatase-like HAD family hydrolase